MQSWQRCIKLVTRSPETFRSKWEKGNFYRITDLNFIFSSKYFDGLVGSDFANPAHKCLQISQKFSHSVVNCRTFFQKWNFFKKFLRTSKIPFHLSCRFLFGQKSRNFWRESENIYEVRQFRTGSFPQIFPLDYQKVILTALTNIFCRKF